MKIELNEITVKELTDGFHDSAEQGVVAYGGKLQGAGSHLGSPLNRSVG